MLNALHGRSAAFISRPSKKLHNIASVGGFALLRFVKQCVYRRPSQIGMTGIFAAAGFVDRVVAAGGGGAADCHE